MLLRAALGAWLNPPFNGPDESGHVEYIRSLVESAGRQIAGAERHQPPLYYALAALPWSLAQGQGEPERLVTVRLLSALCGAGTTLAIGLAAGRVWPARPLLAPTAAALALAPGHLYLLASVSNDPLAGLLASLAVLAALALRGPAGVVQRTDRGWWWLWAAAGLGAVATKPTTGPVVIATVAIVAWPLWQRATRSSQGRRRAAIVLTGAGVAGAIAYAWLLSQPPSTSVLTSLAHRGPAALLGAPLVYVQQGGLAESFRTQWYAYDYGVLWPERLEALMGGIALAPLLVASAGLVGLTAGWSRLAPGLRIALIAAAAQAVFAVGRFSFSATLGNPMGGAAQAKAFFPAYLPLALLAAAGLARATARLGLRDDRWLALFVLAWLLALDGVSLAVTLWQHYRWWQVVL